jgi:hypothetical protein
VTDQELAGRPATDLPPEAGGWWSSSIMIRNTVVGADSFKAPTVGNRIVRIPYRAQVPKGHK